MRLAGMLLVLAVALAACGDGRGVRHFGVDDRSISAHVGDVLAIDLPAGAPGRSCWRERTEDDRVEQLRLLLEAEPGVKQVERRDPQQPSDGRWDDGSDLEVFLNLDVHESQRRHIEQLLGQQADVGTDGVVYVSQQQQFELFTEYFRDQPQYLENVVAEDLPASYKVKVRSLDQRIVAPDRPTASTPADQRSLRFRARRTGTTDIVLEHSCATGDDDAVIVDLAVAVSE